MTIAHTEPTIARKQLRLWPGVIAVALAVFAMFVLPLVAPAATMYGVIGGIVCGLLVLVWWLLFSRVPWLERLAAIALMVLAVVATKRVVDESLSGVGMGMLFYMLSIPVFSLVLVAWAVATGRLDRGRRFGWLVALILVACALFLVVRVDGLSNTAGIDFEWRWSPTAEDRLLAEMGDEPDPVPPAQPAAETGPVTEEAAPAAEVAAAEDAAPMVAAAAPAVDASGAPSVSSSTRKTRSRVARLSRTQPRRHRSRRADRDRLGEVAARRAMAARGRAGMVVVRRRRRRLLHAGAARR